MKQHFLPEETKRLLYPEDMGLVYCSVQRIEVAGEVKLKSGEEELCLICIQGAGTFECEGQRGNVAICDMLYVPIQSEITVTSDSMVIMRYGAPCSKKYAFSHIAFEDVDKDERHKVFGKTENGTRRDVWNFIDDAFPCGRFLTGICYGRDGGWTAWPPHEHGKEREEVYVYFNMDEGFAVQCVYDDFEKPNAHVVQDGHLIAIPHGYHPNVGCPCGGIRYAFVMVSTTEGDRCFMNLRTQKIYGDKLE